MIAIVLFAIAAVGGATLAAMRLQGKMLPVWLALAHGVAAAAGLIALLFAVFGSGMAAKVPLALFLVAAVGGFVLVSFQLRKKEIPIPLMLIHAAVAVVAFVLLLVGLLGGA